MMCSRRLEPDPAPGARRLAFGPKGDRLNQTGQQPTPAEEAAMKEAFHSVLTEILRALGLLPQPVRIRIEEEEID